MFVTPILFLIFNRPETTNAVFTEIRKIKPKHLFIAADGPRPNIESDIKRCQQTREITNKIDWDCDLHLLFRDKNLGCKIAISDAVTWFFNNVSEGIILEDDCLPDSTFFQFCHEMLEYYRYDTRIMQVCGFNLVAEQIYSETSYYFSHLGYIWGWASWARAWKYYDREMSLWPQVRDSYISRTYPFTKIRNPLFEDTYLGNIDTWDFQWNFSIAIHSGQTIIPRVNLIKNIGFGIEDATHCLDKGSPESKLNSTDIKFPLIHPTFLFPNREYEDALFYANRKTIKVQIVIFRRKIQEYLFNKLYRALKISFLKTDK